MLSHFPLTVLQYTSSSTPSPPSTHFSLPSHLLPLVFVEYGHADDYYGSVISFRKDSSSVSYPATLLLKYGLADGNPQHRGVWYHIVEVRWSCIPDCLPTQSPIPRPSTFPNINKHFAGPLFFFRFSYITDLKECCLLEFHYMLRWTGKK